MTEIAGGQLKTPAAALDWVKGLAPSYLQVGAGKTLGRGLVRLRWTGKKAAPRAGQEDHEKKLTESTHGPDPKGRVAAGDGAKGHRGGQHPPPPKA